MRFLGRMSSTYSPKAICQRIRNKFNPSAHCTSCYGRVEDSEWLAVPTKLIKIEEIATLNHSVEVVTFTVENRQSKKCRTTLTISDASVELFLNEQNLFSVGLDQVVTCFSLPSEPRAIALVFKKDSADGYCCACLMLNDVLTSLSGWQVWEILITKQTFFMIREMNRKFTAHTHNINCAVCKPQAQLHSTSSLKHSLSDTVIGLPTSAIQPSNITSFSTSSLSCKISSSSFDSRSISHFTTLSSWPPLSTNLDQLEQVTPISFSTSSLSFSNTNDNFSLDSAASIASLSVSSGECRSYVEVEDEETCQESDVALQDSGSISEAVSSSDVTDEVDGDDIATGTELACDEDTDSGAVLSAGSDVQPLSSDPSAATTTITDDCSHAKAEEIVSDIIDDYAGLTQLFQSFSLNHAEAIDNLEENAHSPGVTSMDDSDYSADIIIQSQAMSICTKDESPTDSGNISGDDISGSEEIENAPNESDGDTGDNELDIPHCITNKIHSNPESKVELSSLMDVSLASTMANTGVNMADLSSECEHLTDESDSDIVQSKTPTVTDNDTVKVNGATEADDDSETDHSCDSCLCKDCDVGPLQDDCDCVMMDTQSCFSCGSDDDSKSTASDADHDGFSDSHLCENCGCTNLNGDCLSDHDSENSAVHSEAECDGNNLPCLVDHCAKNASLSNSGTNLMNNNSEDSATESDSDSCSRDNSCCNESAHHSCNSDCDLHSCEYGNCDDNSSGTSSDSESEQKSKQTDSDSCVENTLCSDLDRGENIHSDDGITESESDFCSHDQCKSEETDSDGDLSGSYSCNDNAHSSHCDRSEENDDRMRESEDSSCSHGKKISQEADSDSDSSDTVSCNCGERLHCSDDDKSDENNSDGSTTESESDSCSDDECRRQQTGSDSDSHSSCGENAHSSDSDESDGSNGRMTDSDSDTCSCSNCRCSCDDCCNHESDSDVDYDSEGDRSSGEDTTDSDYDGDDEDDDESMKHSKCQPVTGISSQFSNKTVRLIRVKNVGLVVMAVAKEVDQDSTGGRNSAVEASSSLQMLKRLGKGISFKRISC